MDVHKFKDLNLFLEMAFYIQRSQRFFSNFLRFSGTRSVFPESESSLGVTPVTCSIHGRYAEIRVANVAFIAFLLQLKPLSSQMSQYLIAPCNSNV